MTTNNTTLTTIETFLADLSRQDIRLWLEGDRLRCGGPEELLTDMLNAQLKARKAEIIDFLQKTQPDLASQSTQSHIQSTQSKTVPALGSVQRPENIPLSFAQQRLWFLHQMQPETAVYNLPMAIQVEGFLDVAALTQSLTKIVERHEILRTRFVTVDGQPVQKIAEPTAIEIEKINLEQVSIESQLGDVSSNSQSALQKTVEQAAINAAQKPFDLSQDQLLRVTLLKLSDTQSVVLFTVHHIVADGWSQEILIQELATFYKAALLGQNIDQNTGQNAVLPELAVQYADFSIWQQAWLQGETLQQQLDYWKQQLTDNAVEDNFSVLQLPTDYPRARVQTYQGTVEQFSLSKQLSEQLKALAQKQSATLFMTLLAALNALLYRYTGQTDLMVGTPIANRHRAEVEGVIGLFVNTLVMRSQLSPQASFTTLLDQVKRTTWAAYDHQDLPFEKLVEYLQPERDLSYSPLFQVKFRLENAPQQTIHLPGLSFQRLPQAVTTAKLDLSVDLYETADGIVGGFEYNCDLFKPETIQRMVVHFKTLLSSIVANPHSPIAELSMLTAEERSQQLVTWNNTQKSYRQDCCFHHLFEEQVEKCPDAIALVFDTSRRQKQDGIDQKSTNKTDIEQLTYRELNHRSNQLAHQLQSLGIGPETVVGICIKRSPHMIIALLAVLKAGGVYLPLDPTYPAERLTYMLADAQVPVLLTQSELLPDLEEPNLEETNSEEPDSSPVQIKSTRINLDTHWPHHQPTTNPQSTVTPNNLAYLIYTSGSTGKPKGVLVPHSGLVNLTEDKIRVCDVRSGDCILQFFSFSFDASIPEIIMALGSGSKLLLAPATTLLPGPELSDLIGRHHVTHMTLTPSALMSVPYGDFPQLRMVLVGGEAPTPELINTWSQHRLFINAYGPTETTVNASMVACGNGHSVEPTLLPSTNKQLYILDKNLQLLPVGVVGELHIGGVGLARGYLNRPALTAERFIPNPFSEEEESLLYKTGDLASYLPDGRIKVLGRIDTQTKIRGFRIELGEVERIIQSHPQVKTALVTVREDTPGDKRLVGYAVPTSSIDKISSAEMRQFVAETLPQYMVPSAFVWLPKLPLTPNGKVDMQALAAPINVSEKPQIAPRTDTEKLLAGIFSQVLSVEAVGVYDDFFELGGHSLLATQLVAQLLSVFSVEITVIDLFEATTVATLANRIEQKQQLAQMQQPIDHALEGNEEREEFAL
ncbi:MAG: amino acid adenylation domain-containing protein [Cyanobacteria bacterium J06621_11]